MSDTNVDVSVFYNDDGDDYNNLGDLSPEGERLLTRLVAGRGSRQLASLQELQKLFEVEVEIFRDWEEMPSVAKTYQSQVGGNRVHVEYLEAFEAKVSDGQDDPMLSFEATETDSAG